MKRTPIQRRTGLKATTGLKPGGPLRPRSEKTQKLYTEKRIPLVKKILEERPLCEACDKLATHDGKIRWRIRPSTDCHEILTRGRSGGVRGKAWLDEANILALCRECHTRITNDPELGEMLGLVVSSRLDTESEVGYTVSDD